MASFLKKCDEGFIRNCKTKRCVKVGGDTYKKVQAEGGRLGDCEGAQQVSEAVSAVMLPTNIVVKEGDSKNYGDSLKNLFEKAKQYMPTFKHNADRKSAQGVAAVALLAATQWAISTAWSTFLTVTFDYVVPSITPIAMMLIVCGFAQWGVQKYQYYQTFKEKIAVWQAYMVKINFLRENYSAESTSKDLRSLKEEVLKYCASEECDDVETFLSRIDMVLNCEDEDDCKRQLDSLLIFLKNTIDNNWNNFREVYDVIFEMMDRPEEECTSETYNVTFEENGSKGKAIFVSYPMESNRNSMSYSEPEIEFYYPGEDEPQGYRNIYGSALIAVKDVLVQQVNAIHLLQYMFLNDCLENSAITTKGSTGTINSLKSFATGEQFINISDDYKDLARELYEVKTDDLVSFTEFFCQFDTHFKKLQKTFENNAVFQESADLLKKQIAQIILASEIKMGYVLDLYNAHLEKEVSSLADPVMLEKYLCIRMDANNNELTGLCDRVMASDRLLQTPDGKTLSRDMSPRMLLEVYQKSNGKSYVTSFKTLRSQMLPLKGDTTTLLKF